MHPAEDDDFRIGAGGGLGEAERVPGKVSHILHLGALVIMGQDDGLALLRQSADLLADVGVYRHTLSPGPSFSYYTRGIVRRGQGRMPQGKSGAIPLQVRRLIEGALEEDGISGDLTTGALVLDEECGRAEAVARAPGGLAGTWGLPQVFTTADPRLAVELLRPEGGRVVSGDTVAAVHGPLASLLKGETVARSVVQ